MSQPYMKRLLLPLALLFWICILLSRTFRTSNRQHPVPLPELQESTFRVPVPHPFSNVTDGPLSLNDHEQQNEPDGINFDSNTPENHHSVNTKAPPALLLLTRCPRAPNQFTNHIRLPNLLYNISMVPKYATYDDTRKFWNPTIIALPSWARNQYLIVSMVLLKDQGYRQNVLCEANICYPKSQFNLDDRPLRKICTEEDLAWLGPNGGLRCVHPPLEVKVSPTPAQKCEGLEKGLADIPGFHDPRAFYSGRGEPILMVVSQSQYACIGLWVIDLRIIHPSLENTFSSSPKRLGPGPLMSYPTLTELTRNPASTRRSYEKNWLMFSPSHTTSYLQYELTPSRRTLAQLVGAGFATPNLTDPLEEPCLRDATPEEIEKNLFMGNALWHQATPALKLVLCDRSNLACQGETSNNVFFAAIQRKHLNHWDLPIRYERYLVVWSAVPPFNMLAISQHPILFSNETTTGWNETEVWDDVKEAKFERRGFWAGMTYTTTIAWAWGKEEGDIREKGIGYLDDEVIMSVGVDDQDQVFGIVTASELLQCLRICPGRL